MDEIDIIFNRYGEAVLRLMEDGRLVDFNGRSFGFLMGIKLYNYHGEHVGWFENGVMRDYKGSCVGFGKNPIDDSMPFLPDMQGVPNSIDPEPEPQHPQRETDLSRPFKESFWSEIEPRSLFLRNDE